MIKMNFQTTSKLTTLGAISVLCLTSCSQSGYHNRGFARLNIIAWDQTDASIEALGYSISFETDHKSIELGAGVSTWDASGNKSTTIEVLIADSEFENLDSLEISGGGRIFIGDNPDVRPYGSIHGVITDHMDAGTQVGLRAGLGAEFVMGTSLFLDFNLNYMHPVSPAEDELFGLLETELDGLSLRAGIGFDF